MFNSDNGPSLADIAAVTGNNDGIGSGNGWWVLVILLELFGGWGNGFGNFGNPGNGTVVTNGDLQRGFDTQSIINKLNGLENGMCSLGYDQLAQMNGMRETFSNGNNAVLAKLNECCCQNREAIAQVRYDMATGNNAITTAIRDAASQIMQNDNANYRALHDENVANAMAAKDAEIQRLNTILQMKELSCSQDNQTNTLINTMTALIAQLKGSGCCGSAA